ncbi:MAG: tRNA (N(6)-L-threonylcarbamoyladenosine(37)-C(2))-methylthiotransferase MtaB [Desulfobacterales bacterium]
MRRFKVVTLGCKLNQCESDDLAGCLTQDSWRACPPAEPADLVVVNTCTVTEKAAMQSRQAIRRAVRENPGAFVVVTGCYAATEPEAVLAIPGVGGVTDRTAKAMIAEIAAQAGTRRPRVPFHFHGDRGDSFPPPSTARDPFAGRTRAHFKIQDGCDAFCSYCIVPYARGPARSRETEGVLQGIRLLAGLGFREVVLTGVHIGRYGVDLSPPRSLAGLLREILGLSLPVRIRLSSIEPLELNDEIVDLAVESSGRLCPHFHIPLQSGDAAVLERMRRPYRPEDFARTVAAVHARLPDAAIGADVLVGFPGETEQAFENTCRLVENLPLSYLHVFPFSPRPGTAAFAFPGRVDSAAIRARCERLRTLGQAKRLDFHRRFLGRVVEVLTETRRDRDSGRLRGISGNYLRVRFPGEDSWMNRCVRVRITATGVQFLEGEGLEAGVDEPPKASRGSDSAHR